MKLSCSVVNDLLPLYADSLCSEESAALVREHLESCEACRQRLETLRQPEAPAAESAAPMKKLKKELRRRRLRLALIAALSVFVVLFALFARADAKKPLAYNVGLLRVEGLEPGDPKNTNGSGYDPENWQTAYPRQALVIDRNPRVSGVESEFVYDEDSGELTLYLQYYSTSPELARSDLKAQEALLRGEVKDVFCPVPDRVIYGFGAEQQLLWGGPMNGGAQILPRLALAYYALIAAGLAALLAILWLAFRKKKAGGVFRQLCFAPLSYLLAQLCVKGTETTSFFLLRDLLMIAVETLAFYALFTLAYLALLQRRTDRAA